ncbi:uncharacterized protein BDR25DRAFT_346700 [Lindgomyces ingoldianus]|uniref:Uncharacterized protein n=1 Tax=Lindgomyces ingoldianus TaxID=673940 RepID=A0ACB6QC43_9PLEO|nr:uncharacterized protein BDR25DRAFT_346700 [Lindgomyces ingoldianus]KAF2464499.1 hypothetical protein BDR25DRAFT_346700 [Lindgomyces ingoldianus]
MSVIMGDASWRLETESEGDGRGSLSRRVERILALPEIKLEIVCADSHEAVETVHQPNSTHTSSPDERTRNTGLWTYLMSGAGRKKARHVISTIRVRRSALPSSSDPNPSPQTRLQPTPTLLKLPPPTSAHPSRPSSSPSEWQASSAGQGTHSHT